MPCCLLFLLPAQLYTAAINACMTDDNTNFDAAWEIYTTMQRHGVEPDDLLYGHLIAIAGRCRKLEVREGAAVCTGPSTGCGSWWCQLTDRSLSSALLAPWLRAGECMFVQELRPGRGLGLIQRQVCLLTASCTLLLSAGCV